jgi:hypothetical protein
VDADENLWMERTVARQGLDSIDSRPSSSFPTADASVSATTGLDFPVSSSSLICPRFSISDLLSPNGFPLE